MKIVRKSFDKNGDLKSKEIITNVADNKQWRILVDRCREKCDWTTLGMPRMLVWKNKVALYTKTGNHFEFSLIK